MKLKGATLGTWLQDKGLVADKLRITKKITRVGLDVFQKCFIIYSKMKVKECKWKRDLL